MMSRPLKVPERHLPVGKGWHPEVWAQIHYMMDDWDLARAYGDFEYADKVKKILARMGVKVSAILDGYEWKYEKPTEN